MTFNSRMRVLAFSGMAAGAAAIAHSGCASTQATGPAAAPTASVSASARAAPAETQTQRCQREWRTRVQDCIIEGVVSGCRATDSTLGDAFYSCVSDGLSVPLPDTPPAPRQVSVTVTAGDEVFSLRSGGPVVMDVVRLETGSVDVNGASFTYTIERIATAAPAQRTPVDQAAVRFNFDGTTTGDVWKLRTLPVWNLRVQTVSADRASVSFETNDQTLVAKPPSPAGGQQDAGSPAPAPSGSAGQKKK